MPSQFDRMMKVLNTIFTEMTDISEQVSRIEAKLDLLREDELDDLFGEDPFDEDDYPGERGRVSRVLDNADGGNDPDVQVDRPKMPGVTRRLVEVKGVDGKTKTVPRDDLDPKIIRVLDASIKAGTFWFLYERESDGQIMISAEEQVINQVGRGEVPPSANEPDLTE